jgi:hypothetical protein
MYINAILNSVYPNFEICISEYQEKNKGVYREWFGAAV